MKYYKRLVPEKWQVHAFESDGSQDAFIQDDMVAITQEEARAIAASEPVDQLVLDALRGPSTVRNWTWPPKAYQEAIGQIVVGSSSIEVLIRTVIWYVANLDSTTGRAFTGKVRVNDLVETLKALVESKSPELKPDADRIGSKINEIFKRRAVYVHQVWTIQNGLPAVGKLFIERYERLEKLTPVTLEEMYRLADEMRQTEADLMNSILQPLMSAR
ncbi:MAG: hypothetical protein ACK5RC_11300 [Curvibacter sp.]